MSNSVRKLFVVPLVALSVAAGLSAPQRAAAAPSEFVERSGSGFVIDGRPFRFAGANAYYVVSAEHTATDNLLQSAADNGFSVIRTWGHIDTDDADGTNHLAGYQFGVFFQYFDGSAPAYNDGANGLEYMDYLIAEAGERNLRLVMTMTNNWPSFGGIPQYLHWAGKTAHSEFFTDPTIRGWYKDYVSHILNRVNTITGVAYKDDPTIMTWELGNELDCAGCGGSVLVDWAAEMAAHIKSIDPNHLVAVGDQGYYCGGGPDWTEDCSIGVDSPALTALDDIDYMTVHVWPDHWGKTTEWATGWISRHLDDAAASGKPAVIEEFGYHDHEGERDATFEAWTAAIETGGGAGSNVWMLASTLANGDPWDPILDGYTIYCPSSSCDVLRGHGQAMRDSEATSVKVTGGIAYDNSGPLRSGDFTVSHDASGAVTAVSGTGSIVGRSGGSAAVSVYARRFFFGSTFTGRVAVRDPGAGINVSAPILFSRVSADGPQGARGYASWFTFVPPLTLRSFRITWNVQDSA